MHDAQRVRQIIKTASISSFRFLHGAGSPVAQCHAPDRCGCCLSLGLQGLQRDCTLPRAQPCSSISGPVRVMQVSSMCGRTLTTCEDLYSQHRAFLSSIAPENAAAMWQYFFSGAASCLNSSEEHVASGRGGHGAAQAATSGRSTALGPSGAHKRTPGKRSKGFDSDSTPNGHRRASTPRQPSRDLLVRACPH